MNLRFGNMMPRSRLYRFFEMVPGVLLWATLLGALILSFIKPLWALFGIVVFDLYWLFRVLYFAFYLTLSWRRLRYTRAINWRARLDAELPGWERILHLVFLPTYKEGIEVLRATLQGLAVSDYPKEKFIVVLAGEERDRDHFLRSAEALRREFGNIFGQFLVTLHPAGRSGEIAGKGSNLNWAGHRVKELIDARGIPYGDIVVSAFDSDTVPHPQYFAHLTYLYLTVPDPLRTSFQPVPLYHNNIWEAPAFLRIAALSTTFWYMTELARPERLWTFSSHSMPFQALDEVGFWETDVVNEDTRILLQCFLKYNGAYRVTPLYLPVSMDTVNTRSYMSSHLALYKQQRRWAMGGAEHIPYLAVHFLRDRTIPYAKKARWIWIVLEGIHSWATAPLLILLLGNLPFWMGGGRLGGRVFFVNAPAILQVLMQLAMVGIIVSVLLAVRMLPKAPAGVPLRRRIAILTQWALLPVSLILFSALPAIDAQTRLMLGKRLGFNVTEKVRRAREFRPAAAQV